MNNAARPLTRELAALAVGTRYAQWPAQVQHEATRALVNWMGCVLGGCHDPAVDAAVAANAALGGRGPVSVVGHGRRTDMASAAFLNCLSSCILAFDDTHLATVTHPTGPVAAALLAYAQMHPVAGDEFANALALGIEIQCRLSNLLLRPPAQSNLGFYITGLTGPIGAAAAVGRLMRLGEEQMACALGLAATQASGFRATHGSMAGGFVPAHAARGGLSAAMLASQGFTCTDTALESGKGFVDVFSANADLDLALDGFGHRFEILANAYKPYPCGIVIHPAIDACLLIAQGADPSTIERVDLKVHPLTLGLTDRPHPRDVFEAMVSLQHWAAASLVQGSAAVAQMRQDCIDDPAVRAMRERICAHADASLARDEAVAVVVLADGSIVRQHVPHARGSIARPMTDAELDAKFDAQAQGVLPEAAHRHLRRQCWNLATLANVGPMLAANWERAGQLPGRRHSFNPKQGHSS